MKLVDEAKIPPFLKSRSFAIAVLRFRQVTLCLFILVGLSALCFVAWYFFVADPSQVENPMDGPLAPLSGKVFAVALVLGWNVLVFWMFIGDRKVLARLKAEKAAEPGAPPNAGPAAPVGNSRVTEGPPSVS
jgi:hypothetical protein